MNPIIRCVEPAACPASPRGLPLRLRRCARDGAAAQDAHARARLPPRSDPAVACATRMSPLLSHVYELGLVDARPSSRTSASRRACCSRAPRASCRRRSPRTRWQRQSGGAALHRNGEEKVIRPRCATRALRHVRYDEYLAGGLLDSSTPRTASTTHAAGPRHRPRRLDSARATGNGAGASRRA